MNPDELPLLIRRLQALKDTKNQHPKQARQEPQGSEGDGDENDDPETLLARAQWFDQQSLENRANGPLTAERQASAMLSNPREILYAVMKAVASPDKYGASRIRPGICLTWPPESAERPAHDEDAPETPSATDPSGVRFLSPRYEVSGGDGPTLLAFNVKPTDFPSVDTQTVIFCLLDNNGAVCKILEASVFLPEHGLLAAYATRPGIYRAAALLPASSFSAAAEGQIERSTSNSWKFLGPTMGATDFTGIGRVTQLDVHPTNGAIVIAASAGGGIWRTEDAGQTWRPTMEDEPTLTMGAVAFAPSKPDFIYAASGEDAGPFTTALQGSGIYRSEDGGKHWTLVRQVTSTRFSAIVVDPKDHLTLYASGNRGLHKSRDGGETWQFNPGLLSLYDGQVTDVVVDYENPEQIYIGVNNLGVLRSSTGGQSCSSVPAFRLLKIDLGPFADAPGWPKLAIGRGACGSRRLAAILGTDGEHRRVFSTPDAGETWTDIGTDAARTQFSQWESFVGLDPEDDARLLVGAGHFVQEIRLDAPGPAEPIRVSPPDFHEDQQDLAFDTTSPGRFYVANDGGVYRSPRPASSRWEFASGGLNITQVYDFDLSEQQPPSVAVCGTQDNGCLFSTDGARTWNQIPGDSTDVTAAVIDPTNPSIFYLSNNRGVGKAPEASGLFRIFIRDGKLEQTPLQRGITGGGSPFVTILKLNPNLNLPNPETGRELFVCGFYHLFHSHNSGDDWQRVEDPLGKPFVPEGEISALEYSTKNPCILYLGTRAGRLYQTSNGGRRKSDWIKIERRLGNAAISSIAIDPYNPCQVWASLSGAGIPRIDSGVPRVTNPHGASHLFRLSNGQTEWLDVSGELPFASLPDAPISSVVVDHRDTDILYVATDVGVFRTSDGGHSWHTFQTGLPRAPLSKLKLNRGSTRLAVGTFGRGIYCRSLSHWHRSVIY
jgi:photosystem II stability/assembly factor-like uncharacterized protein